MKSFILEFGELERTTGVSRLQQPATIVFPHCYLSLLLVAAKQQRGSCQTTACRDSHKTQLFRAMPSKTLASVSFTFTGSADSWHKRSEISDSGAAKLTGLVARIGESVMMQVQLLSEEHGRKEYALIFGKGDEAIFWFERVR